MLYNGVSTIPPCKSCAHRGGILNDEGAEET